MTPDQTAAIIDFIGDLWPLTARPPDKGGYSPRMIVEFKDKLRKYPHDAAEAILSAMWVEPGNHYEPTRHKLFARLSEVVRSEDYDRNYHEQAGPALHIETHDFAERRVHYNSPENFATMSDDAKKGCRMMWGPEYGTGAKLLDTSARRSQQEKAQAIRRAEESQRSTRMELQRGKLKDARRKVASCKQQPWPGSSA